MMPNWIKFDPKGRLPTERRLVLVQIAGTSRGDAPAVAVGFLRIVSVTFFVVPGFGRAFDVTHWADCLGDDFAAPLWFAGMQQRAVVDARRKKKGA